MLCLSISLFTKTDVKRSVLLLGRAHCFYGDYKNRLSLKEYMELAGDYLEKLLS